MPYTAEPKRYDYGRAPIGDTFHAGTRTLLDSALAAYDLTGATGAIEIRTVPGAVLVAEGDFTLDDAANGIYSWLIPAAETAALDPGTYQYAERLTFSTGEVKTIVYGTIRFVASLVE